MRQASLLYVGSDQDWLAALRKILKKPEYQDVTPDGLRSDQAKAVSGEAAWHQKFFGPLANGDV
jgi:hypothetical protein